MILVLEDDGCVRAYESVEDVVQSCEALDAEEVLRAVFDENGQPYRIEWIEPNYYGGSFLGIRWVGNGAYTLVPSGPPDVDALLALVRGDRPLYAGKKGVNVDDLLAPLGKLRPDV